MSPITHFLGSWAISDATGLAHRDRNLVVWCGLLPDLDGAGIVVDMANRLLFGTETFWYGRFHHSVLHGLPGAIAIVLVVSAFATRRVHVFLWGFAIVHLHILCDLVGSRGPTPFDVWPIYYLGPFSNELTIRWAGQWQLNAWPNVAATLLLIGYILYRMVSAGRSPVSMFSERAHHAVNQTFSRTWQRLRARRGEGHWSKLLGLRGDEACKRGRAVKQENPVE
jgi:membrane-bound metal-dependent hydrolase YbcI (DUF457 family)